MSSTAVSSLAPASPARPVRTIALMNQKGGVGKTTTTVNLAAAIALLGRRVLLVDLDPQAHATLHVGADAASQGAAEVAPESLPPAASVYDVLLDPTFPIEAALCKVRDNLWVLRAETDLAALETELAEVDPAQRATRLRAALDKVSGNFDFILIDCPPSLGVLTLNGLAAAREVFIPMQSHFLALQGVSKLLETVALVAKTVNPRLRVTGVVLCMQDTTSNHSKEVVQDLIDFFEQARASGLDVPWKSARVLSPPIRRNIKLAECPSFGQTIFDYAPFCPGALDYRALAERVVGEWDEVLSRRAEPTAAALPVPTAPAPPPPAAPTIAPPPPAPVVRGRKAKAAPAGR